MTYGHLNGLSAVWFNKWHIPVCDFDICFHLLCGRQKEEQTAHLMCFTWGSHIGSSVLTRTQ